MICRVMVFNAFGVKTRLHNKRFAETVRDNAPVILYIPPRPCQDSADFSLTFSGHSRHLRHSRPNPSFPLLCVFLCALHSARDLSEVIRGSSDGLTQWREAQICVRRLDGPPAARLPLRNDLAKRKAVTVQILHHDLADAVGRHAAGGG